MVEKVTGGETNHLRLESCPGKATVEHLGLGVAFSVIEVLVRSFKDSKNFKRYVNNDIWQTVNKRLAKTRGLIVNKIE